MQVEPLYHQQARERLANPPASRCSICAENYDSRDPQRPWHELCKARQDRGLPTPPLPWSVSCGCVQCPAGGFDPDAYAGELESCPEWCGHDGTCAHARAELYAMERSAEGAWLRAAESGLDDELEREQAARL